MLQTFRTLPDEQDGQATGSAIGCPDETLLAQPVPYLVARKYRHPDQGEESRSDHGSMLEHNLVLHATGGEPPGDKECKPDPHRADLGESDPDEHDAFADDVDPQVTPEHSDHGEHQYVRRKVLVMKEQIVHHSSCPARTTRCPSTVATRTEIP